MPGWNPSSATNTLEQTYRAGWVDARRKIADGVEGVIKERPEFDAILKEVVRRIRAGEFEL